MGKYCCDDCKKASKFIGRHVSCVDGSCGAGKAAKAGKVVKRGKVAAKGKSKRQPPAGGKKWLEHVRSVQAKEGIESWKEALKRAKQVQRS